MMHRKNQERRRENKSFLNSRQKQAKGFWPGPELSDNSNSAAKWLTGKGRRDGRWALLVTITDKWYTSQSHMLSFVWRTPERPAVLERRRHLCHSETMTELLPPKHKRQTQVPAETRHALAQDCNGNSWPLLQPSLPRSSGGWTRAAGQQAARTNWDTGDSIWGLGSTNSLCVWQSAATGCPTGSVHCRSSNTTWTLNHTHPQGPAASPALRLHEAPRGAWRQRKAAPRRALPASRHPSHGHRGPPSSHCAVGARTRPFRSMPSPWLQLPAARRGARASAARVPPPARGLTPSERWQRWRSPGAFFCLPRCSGRGDEALAAVGARPGERPLLDAGRASGSCPRCPLCAA